MEPRIHIYVSYPRKNQDDMKARDELERLCNESGFQLMFDEEEIHEGDSLTKFMDDIGAARCVVLFLSHEYFQSAWTLYELVRIHDYSNLNKDQLWIEENDFLHDRFIFPLRASSDLDIYVRGKAEENWHEKAVLRKALCELLAEEDENKAWQRVLNAWNDIVSEYVKKKNPSFEESPIQEILKETLEGCRTIVNKDFVAQCEELRKKIVSEAEYCLTHYYIPLNHLRHKLGIDQQKSITDIASDLTRRKTGDAIAVITGAISEQKDLLKTDGHWDICFNGAEQLCGWLLIGSVNPLWWFHHELRMKHDMRHDIKSQLALESHAYAEVIISRALMRNAEYELHEGGGLIASRDHCNTALLFDSTEKAISTQILTDILNDLSPETNIPDTEEGMVEEIYEWAYVRKDVKKKPVYYLISDEYLQLLEGAKWYGKAKQKLKGVLQFVCCELNPRNETQENKLSSTEDQKILLKRIAYFLSMKKDK